MVKVKKQEKIYKCIKRIENFTQKGLSEDDYYTIHNWFDKYSPSKIGNAILQAEQIGKIDNYVARINFLLERKED